MQAAVQDRYGLDAIEVRDIALPEPAEGQVRIKVHAASVNPVDWHLASGQPRFLRITEGLRRPKKSILGSDVAGVVDAVGHGVTQFQEGDTVFGGAKGSFAEFALANVDRLALVPETASVLDAGALGVAGVTALQAIEKAGVKDQRVLINGASGGVGHLAVQVAQVYGASEVTGVCSGRNATWVSELGADRVIDYTSEDFTEGIYDVIIDCVGSHSPAAIANALDPNGRWVVVGSSQKKGTFGPLLYMLRAVASFKRRSQTCISFIAEETTARLEELAELVSTGQLSVRVADKVALADVQQALGQVESQRIAGKVLLIP